MKKMFRDLWQLKAQFCSVFLMALLGVLIYTGIQGVWSGMDKQGTLFFNQTNLADGWIYGKSFDVNDINSIKNISNVKNAEGTVTVNVKLKSQNNKTSEKDGDMQIICTDGNLISTPKVIEGSPYDSKHDGCWLSTDFANSRNIKVGDSITLYLLNKEKKCIVKGLIMNPEYISYTGSETAFLPDRMQYGYCMVSQDSIKEFLGGISYNQIKVTLSENSDTKQFRKNVENTLGDKYMGFVDRKSFKGVSNYTDRVKQIQKSSIMFSVVFLLMALLTMQTTMKRLVENQRTQIGILKALGFSNRKIIFHYSLYGFIVSLFGALIGFLLAPHIITTQLLNLQKKFYTMPEWKGEVSWVSYLVVIIVVLSCTVTTILASNKGTKGMPAETMRAAAPKGGKQIALEHWHSFWNRLPFEWKWSLRDISRRKTQTIIGIIGVLGCMMLLIASFGMRDSLNHANQYLFGTQYNYTLKAILLPTATDNEKTDLLRLVKDDGQWVQENNVEIQTDRNNKMYIISILDDGNFIHLKKENGEVATLPSNGVAISRKVAQQMKIEIGDTLEFRVPGEHSYCTVTVSEIVTPPSPQGIYISKTEWRNLGQTFSATALLIGNDMKKSDVNSLSYIKEVTTLKDQLTSANEILNSIKIIIVMLLVAAILLSVIILYNLGVLSYTERSREYATLKVLGFHQNEIRAFVLRDNAVNIVIGWVLGVPMGFLFLKSYVSTATTDSFEYIPYLTPLNFIIASCITVGCSLGVSIIISRKVKKMDMVEALKSVE